jgi:hypothetical protein
MRAAQVGVAIAEDDGRPIVTGQAGMGYVAPVLRGHATVRPKGVGAAPGVTSAQTREILSVTIRSTMAQAATVGGLVALGYLGLTAGGAAAQSPSQSQSQSPGTTAVTGATTSTTRVAVATTAARSGSGLANTGADPALLAAVGGGGAAVAIGARRLARRSA